MATPHVSGVAALYLQRFPTASPSQVAAAVRCAATAGVVASPGTGSPNYLLHSKFDGCLNSTEPATTVSGTAQAATTAPLTTAVPRTTTRPASTSTARPSATAATSTPAPSPVRVLKGSLAKSGEARVFGVKGDLGSGAVVSKGQRIVGSLVGPFGTDFDLYLEYFVSGNTWARVASSAGLTSLEKLFYTHTKTKSLVYRWVVYSYRGRGNFTLTEQML